LKNSNHKGGLDLAVTKGQLHKLEECRIYCREYETERAEGRVRLELTPSCGCLKGAPKEPSESGTRVQPKRSYARGGGVISLSIKTLQRSRKGQKGEWHSATSSRNIARSIGRSRKAEKRLALFSAARESRKGD